MLLAHAGRSSASTHPDAPQFNSANQLGVHIHSVEQSAGNQTTPDFTHSRVVVSVAPMGQHHPIEPDFNAATDEKLAAAAHRRQIITYLGVIASLAALLVILLLNM